VQAQRQAGVRAAQGLPCRLLPAPGRAIGARAAGRRARGADPGGARRVEGPLRRAAGARGAGPRPGSGSDLPLRQGLPGQYTSGEFAALAADCQVELSHGRTGQCRDNALAESFFASIKGELIDLQPWPTRAGARRVTEYIGWYNGTRLHSSLGYQTPAEFEASHHNQIKNVA
jgi:transposase InsO family protein